jgi:hypothetical protein
MWWFGEQSSGGLAQGLVGVFAAQGFEEVNGDHRPGEAIV